MIPPAQDSSTRIEHVDNLAEPPVLDTMAATVLVPAPDRCRLLAPRVTELIENERTCVLAHADRNARLESAAHWPSSSAFAAMRIIDVAPLCAAVESPRC